MTDTVTITVPIEAKELMNAVFYNIWSASSPWVIRYGYGSFEEDPTVEVSHYSSDEEPTSTVVNATMLAAGLGRLLKDGYHHCGTPVSADLDEWDACVSDLVLQAAIFDEVVFG